MKATETKFKETELGPIPEEWEIKKLGDIMSFEYGQALKEENRLTGDVPVYGSNGITGWHNKRLVSGPGIVVGRKGSAGEVIFAKTDFFPIDTTYFIKTDLDIKYAYYLLKTVDLKQFVGSSAVPGLNRNDAYSCGLAIPTSRDEQQRISSILSSLDDKIELNRQINANLEKIASALFKRWFVDFEYPDNNGKPYKSSGGKMVESEMGKIPEEWRVEALDEVASFLNGLALQKYPPENDNEFLPVIKIRELNNGITDSTDKASTNIEKEYIVENGDILFSWSGSLDVVVWCGGRGALNQHLFKVTSKKYPKWFYYRWLKYFIPTFQTIAADKAVTMGHIKREHLTESKVLIPSNDVFEKMNYLMQPLLEDEIVRSLEIQFLTGIRGLLLPRLMSGRISV